MPLCRYFCSSDRSPRFQFYRRCVYFVVRSSPSRVLNNNNIMDRWTGRLVVVTDASSGVGRSTVIELSKYPLKIVALDRNIDRLRDLSDELQSSAEAKIYPVQCELTSESDILKAFEWIETTVGQGVSVMINNTGVLVKSKILDGKTVDWRNIFNTNILAATICNRESYKSMKKHNIDDGHFININSTAGHTMLPLPGEKIFNSAKTALMYLTEGLRHEISRTGSKIKVTSISPGKVIAEAADGNVRTNDQPDTLSMMKPERVALMIILALTTPPDIVIAELTVLSVGETIQAYPSPIIK